MVVLSDRGIRRRVEEGTLGIEPFDAAHLTPNGYDLAVREVLIPPDTRSTKGVVGLPAGTWFAVSTLEYIRMPGDLVGMLWLRTSHARRGILATFGVVDAGFEGELTFSCSASRDTTLHVGSRFVQMVFLRMGSVPDLTYASRSGSYQGQRGVTLTSRQNISSPGA